MLHLLSKKIEKLINQYTRIMVYYHDDLDGNVSKTIFEEIFICGSKDVKLVTLIPCNYQTKIEDNDKNILFVFLDLCFKDKILNKYENFIYIDHHSKSFNIWNSKSQIFFEMPSDISVSKILCEIAIDVFFGEKNFKNVIKFVNNRYIINKFDTGIFNSYLEDIYNSLVIIYEKAKNIKIPFKNIFKNKNFRNLKKYKMNNIYFIDLDTLKIKHVSRDKKNWILENMKDLLIQFITNTIYLNHKNNTDLVIFLYNKKLSLRSFKNIDKEILNNLGIDNCKGHEKAKGGKLLITKKELIKNINNYENFEQIAKFFNLMLNF